MRSIVHLLPCVIFVNVFAVVLNELISLKGNVVIRHAIRTEKPAANVNVFVSELVADNKNGEVANRIATANTNENGIFEVPVMMENNKKYEILVHYNFKPYTFQFTKDDRFTGDLEKLFGKLYVGSLSKVQRLYYITKNAMRENNPELMKSL